MKTDALKSLHARLALAMQSAEINHPVTAATVALRFIRDEFRQHGKDTTAASAIAAILMEADE